MGKRLTVRKLRLEQIVIPPRDLGNGLGQIPPLAIIKVYKRPLVRLGHNHDLERPSRPPRTQGEKSRILEDDALLLVRLERRVVLQHVLAAVLDAVLLQVVRLERGLLGQARHGPDLAVRVRVRTAHGRALVFENLHVAVLGVWSRDVRVLRCRGGGRRRRRRRGEGCWLGQ